MLRQHRPLPEQILSRFLYIASAGFLHVVFRLVWRVRIVGRNNIPRKNRLIIAPNHRSNVDPPLTAMALPREVHFMAKEELFRVPLLGWLIRHLNAFPIKRVERDVGAFKIARRILMADQALLVFPEGGRQRGDRLGRAKAGVGMLAIKTQSPVVPVFLHNSDKLGSFKKLFVIFGETLRPQEGESYQGFSDRVMEAVAQLKKEYFQESNS